MAESRESVQGIYCGVAPPKSTPDYREFANRAFKRGPGAFFFTEDKTLLVCRLPCKPDVWTTWAIRPNTLRNGASWDWDGNLETPTLNPSMWWKGNWHGWLKKGRFVSV